MWMGSTIGIANQQKKYQTFCAHMTNSSHDTTEMLSCVTAALHSHEELFKSERRFQILPVPAAQNVVALGHVPKTKRHQKKNKQNANLVANNIYI